MNKKRNDEPKLPALAASMTLKTLRDEALRQHADISKTITQLEELSNEIDATLAFLKTRRGY